MKNKRYDDEKKQNPFKQRPIEPAFDIMYDPMSQLVLEMDVKTTVDSLPQLEKRICVMLLNGDVPNDICKHLNITRNQFDNRHLPFIKARFLEYGFDENEISINV